MESAKFPTNILLSKFWFVNQLVKKTEANVLKKKAITDSSLTFETVNWTKSKVLNYQP